MVRMFAQTGSADIEVEILTLDSVSGTYTSTSHLLGLDTVNYKNLLITYIGNNNGSYQLILSFRSANTQSINYYQVTNTTLTFQQQLYHGIYYYYDIYLTQNTEFLVGATNFSSFVFFQYTPANNTYSFVETYSPASSTKYSVSLS